MRLSKPTQALPSLLITLTRLYLMIVSLTAVQHLIAPQRNGVLALAQIFAPYLFAPAFALGLPVILRVPRLRVIHIAVLSLYPLSFMSVPKPLLKSGVINGTKIQVLDWNLLYTNNRLTSIVHALQSASADIIGLQELSFAQADTIKADPVLTQKYRYQLLSPSRRDAGMGLMSNYPILEHGTLDFPYVMWARLDLGNGLQLIVVNAHPTFVNLRVPFFDARHRDEGITTIRRLIAPWLAADELLLLIGDFNVTSREPAYHNLTAGLHDAARQTRWFPYNTWKSEEYKQLPFGMLRIDYQLSSPHLRPVRTIVDCEPRGSDHCIVHGTFVFEP